VIKALRKYGSFIVRCEILAVMDMKIVVFLVLMQCGCLGRYHSFGRDLVIPFSVL